MRNLISCTVLRACVLVLLTGSMVMAGLPAKAQCYEYFYVYQSYPYGTMCSPGYVTAKAEYYPNGPYTYGEFRWYSSETDVNPVYTSYVDDYQLTSEYSFYGSQGSNVWVSYFNYNTWCESERQPFYVYIGSYPTLSQDYARECGDGVARIQLSSNTAGVYFQLYKLYQYYDPWYGYVDDYQLQESNTTGYFEVSWFDPNEQDKYYVKLYNPYGCSYSWYSQLWFDIVSPEAPSVTGTSTVCQGNGTTLTASHPNVWDFNWYDVATNNLVQNGYQLSVPNTQTPGTYQYYVEGVSYGGCVTNQGYATVVVNPKPVDGTIGASATTICLGQSVTITSAGGIGVPHYWCSNDGGTSWNVFADSYVGQYSFQHTPGALGTYRYHLRNRSDCGFCWDTYGGGCVAFAYVDVTVVAPPSVTISVSTPSFGQGETVLTASIASGIYQWQFNGVDIPGATARTYSAGKSGNYTVRVTSASGCTSVSPSTPVTVANNRNYLITNVIKVPGITHTDQVASLTGNDLQQSIAYLDDLGRTVQTVVTQGSPAKNDVISFVQYDNAGRISKNYLPYTGGNDGSYKTTALASQQSFYQTLHGDQLAYSEQRFDNSPLNRVVEAGAPGAAWQLGATPGTGNVQRASYGRNVANEIRMWSFNMTTKTATGTSWYAANELYVTQQTDEEGHNTWEYKDKAGKTVCIKGQKTINGVTSDLYTYYVFDDLGNVRFNIPSEAFNQLASVSYTVTYNDAFCQRWLFGFDYDQQLRIAEKSVPGGGITRFVYDPLNRLVLQQDPVQATTNQWLFTKYDVMGRTIMNGTYTHGSSLSQSQMQAVVDNYYTGANNYFESRSNTNYSSQHGYTNQSFPVLPHPNNASGQPTMISYYDDYDFDYNGTEGETVKGEPVYVSPGGGFAGTPGATKGKATGQRVMELASGTWLTWATYYDGEGRVIQMQHENYNTAAIVPPGKGRNIEVLCNQYDFTSRIVRTEHRHCNVIADNSFNVNVQQRYVYDHAGRTNEKYIQFNGGPERNLSSFTYTELDQPASKTLGLGVNSLPLETLDYTYNIRGWLRTINKSFLQAAVNPPSAMNWFGMELAYNEGASVVSNTSYVNPKFNGAISGTLWRSRGAGVIRKYNYAYDNLDRLTAADFKQQFGSTWANTDPGDGNFTIDFSMGGKGTGNQYMEYDDNGNIKSLWQKGLKFNNSPMIDNLDYSYLNGNQLNAITDGVPADPNVKLGDFQDGAGGGTDYVYNLNGNLVQDNNKGITIAYNILNLPQLITVTGKGSVQYTYDASGNKLQKIITDTRVTPAKVTTYRYINGFLYRNDVLQELSHPEGRVRWLTPPAGSSAGNYVYDYFVRDYLGNVRTVLTEEQKTDPYPVASLEDVADKNDLNDPSNYIPYYNNTDYTANASFRFPKANVAGYPNTAEANYTTPNNYVAKVNGSGNKIGPSIVLKVMAGDRYNLRVSSWYKTNGTSPGSPADPLADLVAALADGVVGIPGSKVNSPGLQASGLLGPNILQFLNNRTNQASRPKAYLNWVLFDDQLRYVASSSGFEQVPDESVYQHNLAGANVYTHVKPDLTIDKSGYLYVYVSNETQNIDVFFDNLQVTHVRGPLLEESHYYPLGMEMAGISSHINRNLYPLNKWKYQSQEYEGELDIALHEFHARQYDPQIGRWLIPDPAGQFASPYLGMGNSWPNGTDPDGRVFGIDDILIGALIGAAISSATYVGANFAAGGTWKDLNFRDWSRAASMGALGGAIGAGFSGLAGGLGSFGNSMGYSIMSNIATSLAVDVAFGNRITWGSVAGAAVGGALDGAIPKFKGFKHGKTYNFWDGAKNAVGELAINSARGGVIGSISGGIGALADGGDVGEGISSGFRSGAIGAGIRTGINLAVLGPSIRPSGKVRESLEKMEKDLNIKLLSGAGSPVYRIGGLMKLFGVPGITVGNSLMVTSDMESNDGRNTWIHESYHYYQQLTQTWMGQMGKGMKEQWIMRTLQGIDPYGKKGTNEYNAYWYAEGYYPLGWYTK